MTNNIKTVSISLLKAATQSGFGSTIYGLPLGKFFNAVLSGGSGNRAATIVIEGCAAEGGWSVLGTMMVSSATPTDSLFFSWPTPMVRARIVNIIGTGATVDCSVGVEA